MEEIDFTRFVLAFIFVVGLIGCVPFALRRLASQKKWMMMKNEGGRLQVIETRYLDTKRKLMLVRRDETEHLLLLGEGSETVVESDIKAPVMQSSYSKAANDHA